MKTRTTVLLVVLGVIVGWRTASVMAQRDFDKIKKSWPFEVQNYVAENLKFEMGLTQAEREQFRQDIRANSARVVKELDIQTLGRAILAIQVQLTLASGDTNRVHELVADTMTRLKEAHAAGRFKGTDSEGLADALVFRMEAGTNSPTNRPEATE